MEHQKLQRPVAAWALSAQSTAQQSGIAPTAHLLLVEDNPINQMVIAGLTQRLGYKGDIAANSRKRC